MTEANRCFQYSGMLTDEKYSLASCRMDWTDVHYRQMARLISKHTWLYTEMVVDQTIIHNPNTDR